MCTRSNRSVNNTVKKTKKKGLARLEPTLCNYRWCERGDSNSQALRALDPKSSASASSATLALHLTLISAGFYWLTNLVEVRGKVYPASRQVCKSFSTPVVVLYPICSKSFLALARIFHELPTATADMSVLLSEL